MSMSCNERCNAEPLHVRLFCKKGCDSEEEGLERCRAVTCVGLCVRDTLGEEQKMGWWSSFLSRKPASPDECLSACHKGCVAREG
jgi:hypothetical protein